MERTLTVAQARAFYDRLGARQDNHGFYEDHALSTLRDHAAFHTAASVFEFGCGTGRFAERLLAEVLPPNSRYVGVDISSTMVDLARERFRRWPDRAQVRLSEGSPELLAADGSFDRVVSSYVLDLLSEDDISTVLAEAARILSEDGRLCLVSLTHGQGPLPRLVSWRGSSSMLCVRNSSVDAGLLGSWISSPQPGGASCIEKWSRHLASVRR